MEREFRSKAGWWYHFMMILLAAGCVIVFLQANIWPIIGMTLCMMLAIHVFLNTWYRVTDDGMLIVHCSIFPEKRIAINEITELEQTILPAFSYALSLDRIMIWAGDKPWMMVSPKNKQEFVKLLRSINPDIRIRKESSFI